MFADAVGMHERCYILGSRSPRRRELLQLLVPADRLVIRPPLNPEEAGFAGLKTSSDIADRLRDIVAAKRAAVGRQLTDIERRTGLAIVADTIIVAQSDQGTPVVLGQPPDEHWQPVVRTWFEDYYSHRTHEAWTGVCAWNSGGTVLDSIARTRITFRDISAEEIDWYLETGESPGKAGGYAIQGLANLFVEQIQGSLSNVIGLPLELLRPVLACAGSGDVECSGR